MSHSLIREKFADPFVTSKGDERAHVRLKSLDVLWFNTGTLCNIACKHCYIESSPSNDRLVYLSLADVVPFLDEIVEGNRGTAEIGFTGGEPFMNPDMIPILEATLERGFKVLILSNAMRPMQRPRIKTGLLDLLEQFPDKIRIRVSLDHYCKEKYEEERGSGSWDPTMDGIEWLAANRFSIDIAGRMLWGDTESELRDGFAELFSSKGWDIDAYSPGSLVIFPEMDGSMNVPEITTECWKILNVSQDSVMCSSSRMIVKRRGESSAVVLPCTLLPYDSEFEMGRSLDEADGYTGGAIVKGNVFLNHPHCSKFCVCGGASCAGA